MLVGERAAATRAAVATLVAAIIARSVITIVDWIESCEAYLLMLRRRKSQVW
jgi:hypothetical protein